MVKISIKLVDDSSAESQTLVETVPEGMTLEELIEKKVASVGWTDRELIVKSAQLYDEDFKQLVDITEPLDSLVILNLQRFEVHLNKAAQILLNGVNGHLWLISKTKCIIWVDGILKQEKIRIELIVGDDGIFVAFKSCLCLDPSAPVGSRVSQVADMNYERYGHSLIVANGKLYAIRGDPIEEYDPQTNEWREVGKLT
ncbi:hypothetical protein WR25_15315 [Diploscapter pachys]|uniref:Uncharacterized protein n=1 Tax=Diploscapter pachys TaxID=2018661 RepID=A0A2A2M140_9BILA|nr:hypothetical protein WR25_15315 [Diploscapter pachys]